jgi:succinyl-CoA synthetase beta subunit
LITHQTGPEGKKVSVVLIEEVCELESEYYAGIVFDRSTNKITFMASSEGGVDIETVASKTPEKIIKVGVDPAANFSPFVGRKLAYGIGLKEKDQINEAINFFRGLYEVYTKCDCTIVEVNPLVRTKSGELLALDAKLNFDDNSLFRHPEIERLRDPLEESVKEMEAAAAGFSYIELDGDIGCLVNGAGLAMATTDIISFYGGMPANFLDVGGGASQETVKKAFSIILEDEAVKAIFVNIFGGIMKCDIIAEGIVAAAKEVGIKVPLVVRLEGTNVAIGRKILEDSGLNISTANELSEAAKMVVQAAKEE